jgi:hypothetical protein
MLHCAASCMAQLVGHDACNTWLSVGILGPLICKVTASHYGSKCLLNGIYYYYYYYYINMWSGSRRFTQAFMRSAYSELLWHEDNWLSSFSRSLPFVCSLSHSYTRAHTLSPHLCILTGYVHSCVSVSVTACTPLSRVVLYFLLVSILICMSCVCLSVSVYASLCMPLCLYVSLCLLAFVWLSHPPFAWTCVYPPQSCLSSTITTSVCVLFGNYFFVCLSSVFVSDCLAGCLSVWLCVYVFHSSPSASVFLFVFVCVCVLCVPSRCVSVALLPGSPGGGECGSQHHPGGG